MKRNLIKRIAVLTAVAVMGMSMAACGNKAGEAEVNEPAATEETAQAEDTAATEEAAQTEDTAEEPAAEQAGVLTEEEYVAKAQEASEKLVTAMTSAKADLEAMDTSDLEAVSEYIEGLKAPLAEFAALQAPEKFAQPQAKFKSSCEALMEYFDLCIQMLDPEAEADTAELTAKTTEIFTTVQTDLTEAYTLMDELTSDTEEAAE